MRISRIVLSILGAVFFFVLVSSVLAGGTSTVSSKKKTIATSSLGFDYYRLRWHPAGFLGDGIGGTQPNGLFPNVPNGGAFVMWDTIQVARDFNGNGAVDSIAISADYAPVAKLRIVYFGDATAPDTLWIKWLDEAGVVIATTRLISPVNNRVQEFEMRASRCIVTGGRTNVAGNWQTIGLCER
jgi:hypothetical protein